MIGAMIRRRLFLAFLALCVVAVLPAATSAQTAEPSIKADEVGFFGPLASTKKVSVIVYSRTQPNAGTRVTVCFKGVCKKATGHRGSVAWYLAAFPTKTTPMWAPITYSVVLKNKTGRATTKVTRELLCIKNDGSSPEADPLAA
jgi:hypothetical protein